MLCSALSLKRFYNTVGNKKMPSSVPLSSCTQSENVKVSISNQVVWVTRTPEQARKQPCVFSRDRKLWIWHQNSWTNIGSEINRLTRSEGHMFLSKDVSMERGQKPSADRPIIISADGTMGRILSSNLQENMRRAEIKHMSSEHIKYFTYYIFVFK